MRKKKIRYVTLHDRRRVKVDAIDRKWAKELNWHLNYGYPARTFRDPKNGYAYHKMYMHREIMRRILGRKIPKHLVVDHKNRDRRDNRRSNLRLLTVKKNNHNRTNILMWDGERWVYEPHGRLHE